MAQTDIETLEDLPIKKAEAAQQQAVINLVNKIIAITRNEDYLSNPTKQSQVKEFEYQIDLVVYDLYGLTPEEIAVVEREK